MVLSFNYLNDYNLLLLEILINDELNIVLQLILLYFIIASVKCNLQSGSLFLLSCILDSCSKCISVFLSKFTSFRPVLYT